MEKVTDKWFVLGHVSLSQELATLLLHRIDGKYFGLCGLRGKLKISGWHFYTGSGEKNVHKIFIDEIQMIRTTMQVYQEKHNSF